MLDKLKKVIREIHSEPGGGTLSWGRCAATGSLIVVIGCILHVVIHTHTIPDLGSAALFVVSPYTANRVATAVQSFSSSPVTPTATRSPT
jgi:hypothetical protein